MMQLAGVFRRQEKPPALRNVLCRMCGLKYNEVNKRGGWGAAASHGSCPRCGESTHQFVDHLLLDAGASDAAYGRETREVM